LQGQLSNDIDRLEEGEVQLNAYCQHQGKIIALLWVMKRDDDFYLSFPSDLDEIIKNPIFVVNLHLFVFFLQISVDFMNHIRIIRTISTTS
jgi:folate-binding Fe-S cluster repair protein YgfZ